MNHTTLLESAVEDSTDQHRTRRADNRAAIALLDAWAATDDTDDEREQQQTWAHLQTALDDNRLSYRQLFPGK